MLNHKLRNSVPDPFKGFQIGRLRFPRVTIYRRLRLQRKRNLIVHKESADRFVSATVATTVAALNTVINLNVSG